MQVDYFFSMVAAKLSGSDREALLSAPVPGRGLSDAGRSELLQLIGDGAIPNRERLPHLSQSDWYGYQDSLTYLVQCGLKELKSILGGTAGPARMAKPEMWAAVCSLHLYTGFVAGIGALDYDSAALLAFVVPNLDVHMQIGALAFLEEIATLDPRGNVDAARADEARLIVVSVAAQIVSAYYERREDSLHWGSLNYADEPLLRHLFGRVINDAQLLLRTLYEIDNLLQSED